MIIKGKLHVASPIYRGNARKTLFTRDGDGTHRLVSLAGEISGTAQALMDAFIGESRNRKNTGLINQVWKRLYDSDLPGNLIKKVECSLQKSSYPRNNFFDMRMGIRLDEDRWAAEANANYKMETVLRNSVFDFTLSVNESLLGKDNNSDKLHHVLEEIKAERFWFGAGKSKGLGRVRLETGAAFKTSGKIPTASTRANHLRIDMAFDAQNPVLVGWNWGKIDPFTTSFSSIEARLLIGAMRNIPDNIRDRLEMSLGGAILNPDDWKKKFAEFLPRVIAICLRESSSGEAEFYVLPAAGLKKLGKGKHALNKKLLKHIEPLSEKPFASEDEADEAFKNALGKKANMAKRIMAQLELKKQDLQELDKKLWEQIADSLGMDKSLESKLSKKIGDENELILALNPACEKVLPGLFQQVDQHIKMLQSDAWVDAEIQDREMHLLIKKNLKSGKITQSHWDNPNVPPKGIKGSSWKEFLRAHDRVQFRHMLNNKNLDKSITNDVNHIEFLKNFRDLTRQELTQPHHIDYRAGGKANREISQKYGKPYDTIFMRMLTWTNSTQEQGSWEAYIPGGTIKGAFRKRASQLLKTLWGEGRKTDEVLNTLFGRQGQRGLVFFSDAYLIDPENAEKAWCSMDGVKMDPKTGQPVETAKHDYLYAYGDQLGFKIQMDLQDIGPRDMEAMSVFLHLVKDFQAGDIPLGGEKTTGFGWVQAQIAKLTWLTGDKGGVTKKLFPGQKVTQQKQSIWNILELEGEKAAKALEPKDMALDAKADSAKPPTARAGFISHRAFGGYCGMLCLEAQTLTPVNISESGEPSFTTTLDDGPVNGWDFFSMSPPGAKDRAEDRIYAMPSRSIKGMIRHIYTIASNSTGDSRDISKLNPVDSLFGWVGEGPNQAIMGRLSFNFAKFENPELAWFKVPYPYGDWQYSGGKWTNKPDSSAAKLVIDNKWRIFPHAPLAPIAEQVKDFNPDTFQARYFKAILPGAKARFNIRFWNLTQEEFQNLLWCTALEPGLAHKTGNNRYLGFGSIRLSITGDSYLTDWEKRYAGLPEDKWRQKLEPGKYINTKTISHYKQLAKALDAANL